jgi:hypothetical protein
MSEITSPCPVEFVSRAVSNQRVGGAAPHPSRDVLLYFSSNELRGINRAEPGGSRGQLAATASRKQERRGVIRNLLPSAH